MQLRLRQSLPQPAQVPVTGVGQSHGASSQHSRGHPWLAHAALGHRHQAQPVPAQKAGHGLGVPPYGLDVHP
jgi:hypothetical protein